MDHKLYVWFHFLHNICGVFRIFLLSKCIVPLKHLVKCSEICEIRLKFNLIARLFWCCTYPGTAHFRQGISPEELSILRPFHTVRNTLCAQTCSQRVPYPAFAPSFLLSVFYPHSHCSCTDLTWSKKDARPPWFLAERAIDLCPECFPGCKTAKKVQMKSLTLFSFLLCAIEPESLPYSQRTCKLPQHTWATSRTQREYFPRLALLLLSYSTGLGCCLLPQCLLGNKNPAWEWNTEPLPPKYVNNF